MDQLNLFFKILLGFDNDSNVLVDYNPINKVLLIGELKIGGSEMSSYRKANSIRRHDHLTINIELLMNSIDLTTPIKNHSSRLIGVSLTLDFKAATYRLIRKFIDIDRAKNLYELALESNMNLNQILEVLPNNRTIRYHDPSGMNNLNSNMSVHKLMSQKSFYIDSGKFKKIDLDLSISIPNEIDGLITMCNNFADKGLLLCDGVKYIENNKKLSMSVYNVGNDDLFISKSCVLFNLRFTKKPSELLVKEKSEVYY